jgi:hypothetical protein
MVFVLEERGLETIYGNISSQPLANEKAEWVIYMPRLWRYCDRPTPGLGGVHLKTPGDPRKESCRFPSLTSRGKVAVATTTHMDRRKLFARANHPYQPSA